MSGTDWLVRYAIPDSGWKECETVHRGDGRAVVTDRVCILAVDDPGATLGELDMGKDAVTRCVRESLAEAVPPDALRFDLGDLWLWLDRVDREQCPECRQYPDDAKPFCQECDGRGWVRPEPGADDYDADTVGLADALVDRWRLAWWLPGELEPLGTAVAVWRSGAFGRDKVPALGGNVLALDGGGWRLIVMSLDPTDRRGKVYRTYHPGAGLWWQNRRCPVARLSALDWFAERGVDVNESLLFGATA